MPKYKGIQEQTGNKLIETYHCYYPQIKKSWNTAGQQLIREAIKQLKAAFEALQISLGSVDVFMIQK